MQYSKVATVFLMLQIINRIATVVLFDLHLTEYSYSTLICVILSALLEYNNTTENPYQYMSYYQTLLMHFKYDFLRYQFNCN